MSPPVRRFRVRVDGVRAGARWRAAMVALATASTLLVGCASDDTAESSATPEAATSTSPTPSAAAAEQLTGTWRTDPVSVEDTVETLGRHGLDEWIEEYRANAPFAGETVLELSVADGEWNLYGESADGQREPIDHDALYSVDGDTVTFVHFDGANIYRWEVDGDTLRLDFLRSTLPGVEGVPEEVFQRALYMTAAFTRQT